MPFSQRFQTNFSLLNTSNEKWRSHMILSTFKLFTKKLHVFEHSATCIIFHNRTLFYIIDKPKWQWVSQINNGNSIVPIEEIVYNTHEHISQTVWIENVRLRLLCFNFKNTKYKTFKVYGPHGLTILCFHLKGLFEKLSNDLLFVYDSNNLKSNKIFLEWNTVLQNLKFNIQIKVGENSHQLLKIDPISLPIYDMCQKVEPVIGAKWRVPALQDEREKLRIMLVSDYKLSSLQAISFDRFWEYYLSFSSHPELMTIGPVKLNILKYSIHQLCPVCSDECVFISESKKAFRNEIINTPTIEISISNIRNPLENILMFAVIKEHGAKQKNLYKKIKEYYNGISLDTFIKILEIWHQQTTKKAGFAKTNCLANTVKNTMDILNSYNADYMEKKSTRQTSVDY